MQKRSRAGDNDRGVGTAGGSHRSSSHRRRFRFQSIFDRLSRPNRRRTRLCEWIRCGFDGGGFDDGGGGGGGGGGSGGDDNI